MFQIAVCPAWVFGSCSFSSAGIGVRAVRGRQSCSFPSHAHTCWSLMRVPLLGGQAEVVRLQTLDVGLRGTQRSHLGLQLKPKAPSMYTIGVLYWPSLSSPRLWSDPFVSHLLLVLTSVSLLPNTIRTLPSFHSTYSFPLRCKGKHINSDVIPWGP